MSEQYHRYVKDPTLDKIQAKDLKFGKDIVGRVTQTIHSIL